MLFKSRLLPKESKVKLYTAYLRPIALYGCETWSITKGDEKKLLRFERKILRRIYTDSQEIQLMENLNEKKI